MIEQLVPDDVATAEAFHDPAGPPNAYLYSQEASVVAAAVDKRQREFTTVRICARRALGTLGYPPVPLLPGTRGAPRWPDGVVGSMTHCDSYRAAAVARTDAVASIGIDAEPNAPLPDGVLDVIALAEERDRLKRLQDDIPEVHWDRLLFSAKESVFKTWYPLTHRELDFDQARIEVAPAPDAPTTGTFTAHLLIPAPTLNGHRLHTFTGNWLSHAGLLTTAITVRRT
ncbi:4'-phosphopantetheinyl transferase superfamily protein [Streptomyces sp. NPDC050315]|uniref:4'-phosphopantetheinyl transferase family protein n=1 Tax=Streptomyces sp. NPDC050315 TaxID=3155039 RepID=UPI0034382097